MNPPSPEHKENTEMKLLPCPFCSNSEIQIRKSSPSDNVFFWIHCEDCGAQGPFEKSISIAEEAWNTRPAPVVVESAIQEAGEVEKAIENLVHDAMYSGDPKDIKNDEQIVLSYISTANAALLQVRAENAAKTESLLCIAGGSWTSCSDARGCTVWETRAVEIAKTALSSGGKSRSAASSHSSRAMIEEMEKMRKALELLLKRVNDLGDLDWDKDRCISEQWFVEIKGQIEAALNPQKKES